MSAMRVGPTLLRGGRVIDPAHGIDAMLDVLLTEGGSQIDPATVPANARIVDTTDRWVIPGLIDLQVHFREPGFNYKEDLMSGSRAALAGGVTTAVVMPNTRPTLDTPELVADQTRTTREHGGIRILVAACASLGMKGEALTDVAALKRAGAVALTDDGLPLLDDGLMERALMACRKHDLVFMQHAEDTRVTHHAPMNSSATSQSAGVAGQPDSAEASIVERDIALAEKVGARYHVLHCSTRRSLDAVRAARARGVRVTCEASPHHLLLTDRDCVRSDVITPRAAADLDPNRKMNPPLRDAKDRDALVEGIIDGSIDAVATDHAPHHEDEKAKGFVDAPFGVIGLETAFAALLTFVDGGAITPLRAVELMTQGPARVLGLADQIGRFGPGGNDAVIVDPRREWNVTSGGLLSKSKNSAFYGMRFRGRVTMTFLRGFLAYERIG